VRLAVLALTRLAVLALALLVLVACSGGSSSDPATTGGSTGEVSLPDEDPAVGEALRQFVGAAANGDIDAMWELLSAPSRAYFGGTPAEFAHEVGADLQRGLGSFAGRGFDTVLSVRTDSGFGVAAIAGPRVRDGREEYAAYGAALREENGAWRLELGAPVELATNAPPRSTTERSPAIQFEVAADAAVDEAGVWLDGAALPSTAQGRANAVTVVTRPEAALAPGWHVLVVFGRAGDSATAGATPFLVEGEEGPAV
jgi:hypothetical protein